MMEWLSISCLSALTLPSAALTVSLVLQETDQQALVLTASACLCLPLPACKQNINWIAVIPNFEFRLSNLAVPFERKEPRSYILPLQDCTSAEHKNTALVTTKFN